MFDLDCIAKVKFNITIEISHCGFPLMLNTFHMSILLQCDATGHRCCVQCIFEVKAISLYRSQCDLTINVSGSPGASQNPQETDYRHYYSFVPPLNIAILYFVQFSVTLRMMSRSNCLYGTKVLVRTIIWHIENDAVVKSH